MSTTIHEVGPLVDTSQGETLAEMVGHVVALRNIQAMWLQKQRETDPLAIFWWQCENHFNSACDREEDLCLRLTVKMLEQGIEYVTDDTGRFYAAMACLTGHPGSLYAHVGEVQQ